MEISNQDLEKQIWSENLRGMFLLLTPIILLFGLFFYVLIKTDNGQ